MLKSPRFACLYHSFFLVHSLRTTFKFFRSDLLVPEGSLILVSTMSKLPPELYKDISSLAEQVFFVTGGDC